jgi:predicted GTPase
MAQVHLRQEPDRFGERQALDQFRNLDKDWSVFYSVGLIDRKGFDRQREIDFVLLHPEIGLIFVEVKGGKVQFEDGVVSQFLDGRWKVINPITQLNDARRLCLDFFKSRGITGFLPARNLYVFPNVPRPRLGLSQELEDCSLFSDELQQTHQFIVSFGRTDKSFPKLPVSEMSRLLENCLVYKSGFETVLPRVNKVAPEQKSRPEVINRDLPNLRQIIGNPANSFSNTEIAKRALSAQRESLQELWNRTLLGRTEIETYGNDSEFDNDALVQILSEVQKVLSSSTVDIGVFGQVKRGKSTVVNAIVGREVSATGMLPKTAVPVFVEFALEEVGTVFLEDGTKMTVSLENAVEMTTQNERRRRQLSNEARVDHVIVGMPLGWMPRGVRIVDTPGLSDPSLSDDYETYALNELERIGAAVLVISYPPGPEQHEILLIEKLARLKVSKVFFVVNMFTDYWKKKSSRVEARDYMLELIRGAQTDVSILNREDEHVFVVNAGLARDAQESRKTRNQDKSNISELRDSLEKFISTESLSRISTAAAERLLSVAIVVGRKLDEREKLLRAPEHLNSKKADLATSIMESELKIAEIGAVARQNLTDLQISMNEKIHEEFAGIRSRVAATRDRRSLQQLESRIGIQTGTLATTLIRLFHAGVSQVVESSRRSVVHSTGDTSWSFANNGTNANLFSVGINEASAIADYRPPSDLRNHGRAAGGILGSVLGGGAGIALATAGPLGLIIGGLLGVLMGDSIGELFSDSGNSSEASSAEIASLLSAIDSAESSMRSRVDEVLRVTSVDLVRNLESFRASIIKQRASELNLVEALIGDTRQRDEALAEILKLRAELLAITG